MYLLRVFHKYLWRLLSMCLEFGLVLSPPILLKYEERQIRTAIKKQEETIRVIGGSNVKYRKISQLGKRKWKHSGNFLKRPRRVMVSNNNKTIKKMARIKDCFIFVTTRKNWLWSRSTIHILCTVLIQLYVQV